MLPAAAAGGEGAGAVGTGTGGTGVGMGSGDGGTLAAGGTAGFTVAEETGGAGAGSGAAGATLGTGGAGATRGVGALGSGAASAPVSGGQSAPLKAKLTSEDARIAVSPGQSPSQSMTPGRPQAKKGRMSLKRDPPLRKWSWTSSKLAPSLSVADGANAVISELKSYIVERLPGAADEENRHLQRQGLLPVPRDHQSPRGGQLEKRDWLRDIEREAEGPVENIALFRRDQGRHLADRALRFEREMPALDIAENQPVLRPALADFAFASAAAGALARQRCNHQSHENGEAEHGAEAGERKVHRESGCRWVNMSLILLKLEIRTKSEAPHP